MTTDRAGHSSARIRACSTQLARGQRAANVATQLQLSIAKQLHGAAQPRPQTAPATDKRTVIERFETVVASQLAKALDGKLEVLTRYGLFKPYNTYPTPQSQLSRCTPISVAELKTTQKVLNRVLRGTIAVEQPIVNGENTVRTLLEDDKGSLIMIAVYDLIPLFQDLIEGHVYAREILAKGRRVAIVNPTPRRDEDTKDPFFAVSALVENPRQVYFPDANNKPMDPARILAVKQKKAAGDASNSVAGISRSLEALLKQQSLQAASVSRQPAAKRQSKQPAGSQTSSALDSWDSSPALTAQLLNLSACHMALDQPHAALSCALTAIALQQSNGKAYYRAAIALDRLASSDLQHQAALAFMQQAVSKLGAGAATRDRLMNQLSDSDADPCSYADALQAALQVVTAPDNLTATFSTAAPAREAAASSQQAAAALQQAEKHYGAGQYQTALQSCQQSIAAVVAAHPDIVGLLSKRSQCQLDSYDSLEAVHDALAACLLSGNRNSDAPASLIRASLQLGWLAAAEAVVDQALLLEPNSQRFAALRDEVNIAIETGGDLSISERAARRMQQQGALDPEYLTRKHDMFAYLQSLPALKDAPKLVDTRVPAFHQEYEAENRWPRGCGIPAAKAFLSSAYEDARTRNVEFRNTDLSQADAGTKGKRADKQKIMKRMSQRQREVFSELALARMGQVVGLPRRPYPRSLRHSYPNVPVEPMTLQPGTTHVAVGFLDFTGLADAVVEVTGGSGPVQWVGYDASPYAVGKALVIRQMLTDGADPFAIMQVWYSAAWSNATHSAFKTSLTALIQQCEQTQSQPDVVVALLKHWAGPKVTLEESCQRWMDVQERTGYRIGNFNRRSDRLALCEYFLTGQLGPADVGSVVMFCVPDDDTYGQQSMDENVFQTLSFNDLFGSDMLKDHNIVETAAEMLRHRVTRLRDRLHSNMLTLEACLVHPVAGHSSGSGQYMRANAVLLQVRLATVTPTNTEIINEIHTLTPATMSWSNVPDYMSAAEFHDLARRCSRGGHSGGHMLTRLLHRGNEAPPGTVHFAHLMNWERGVKGAYHWHYDLSPWHSEQMKPDRVLDSALDVELPALYRELGCEDILMLHPVEDPMAIADCSLQREHVDRWLEHWFKHDGSTWFSVRKQVTVLEPPEYNVFMRNTSTFSLAWSYDPSTDMQTHIYGKEHTTPSRSWAERVLGFVPQ